MGVALATTLPPRRIERTHRGPARERVAHWLGALCVACSYREVASHPDGRALLAARPDLKDALGSLDDLPKGSLGRAAAQFARLRGDVPGPEAKVCAGADPEHRWLHARLEELRPVLHALTGYDADEAGALGALAFASGQTRAAALPLLIVVALLWARPGQRSALVSFAWQAFWRGRRAVPLAVVRFEDLLPRSLEVVRQSLAIAPCRQAHPQGIPTTRRRR